MKSNYLYFLILFIFSLNMKAQVFIPFISRCYTGFTPTTSDTLNSDFTAGTTSNTTVSGASVVLSAGQTTGTFTSRVFSLSGSCQLLSDWQNITWQGSLPYGKFLPDYSGSIQNETTAAYSGLSSNTLMNNIIGLWHFQETSTGTATGGKDFVDNSGNNNHGTRVNSVTLNSTGQFGRALTFDGVSSYINFGTPSVIDGTGNFTMSFWIKPTTISAQTIYYRSDNNVQQGFWVTLSGTGQIRFQMIYASANSLTQTSNTLVANTWYHIVILSDSSLTGNNSKIYINGTQATYTGNANGSGAHSSASTQTMFLGAPGTGTSGYFKGLIEELAFFNTQITATQITELYRRGINRVKFQVRSCVLSNCADSPAWVGFDGTNTTYFTELNNNRLPVTWLSTVFPSSPNMVFGKFSNMPSSLQNNLYFQYKVILESDNTTYQPDLKNIYIYRL